LVISPTHSTKGCAALIAEIAYFIISPNLLIGRELRVTMEGFAAGSVSQWSINQDGHEDK
jgi:hypothetical protein